MTSAIIIKNDRLLCCQPQVVKKFGRSSAQFISQLDYWLKKPKLGVWREDRHWIFNSAEEFGNQISLSKPQTQRIIKKLRDLKILLVRKFGKWHRVNYYSIDYEMLQQLVGDNESSQEELPVEEKTEEPSNEVVATDTNDTTLHHSDVINYIDDPQNIINNSSYFFNKLKKITRGYISARAREGFEPRASLQNGPENVDISSPTAEMFKIWKENLEEKAHEFLDHQTETFLLSAFRHKFGEDLNNWKFYCQKIRSSSYLMGENFQLSLSWALKWGTIDRIQRGEFGVVREAEMAKKNETSPASGNAVTQFQMESLIRLLQEDEELKKIRRHILLLVGPEEYYSWFHRGEYTRDGKNVYFTTPSHFVADTLENKRYPFMQEREDLRFFLQSKDKEKSVVPQEERKYEIIDGKKYEIFEIG